MLDGRDSRANRRVDPLSAVRVRGDPRAVLRRLGHRGVHLLLGKLLDAGLRPRGEHRAGGDHLDEIRSVIENLAHALPHLGRRVGDAESHVGWERDIGGLAGDLATAAAHRDVRAGDGHVRAHHHPVVDVVA